MKALNKYLISKNTSKYQYCPKTKNELKKLLEKLLSNGMTNLNCIDVSNITDMSWIFFGMTRPSRNIKVKEINISEWDVSNVEDMAGMFKHCDEFNADISKWDVSNVKDMAYMFYGCEKFNCDLNRWNVTSIKSTRNMFSGCDSLKNIPDWYEK